MKDIKTEFNKSNLIFKIAKLTAEEDSIYEGWRYNPTYTKNIFDKESTEYYNHKEQAIQILKIIAKHLGVK